LNPLRREMPLRNPLRRETPLRKLLKKLPLLLLLKTRSRWL